MKTESNHCGLLRRLASITYDSLLLTAVLFFSTLILLPFTRGQAISNGNILYTAYLFFICYLYFAWQWTHGGQTLGMRTWKIRLRGIDSDDVTWQSASLRFLLACLSWGFLGAGFLRALIGREHLAFHDKYSKTRLMLATDRQLCVNHNK